ncbi:ATP-binding cassette domain-containing protein [Aeromicrobium sp. S22]|uniref:ABC transporter ATP-binding protein n=1 Tax=Aeromicrobium sp. S22 TaxID=2662029 RepID=UPI00129E1D2E|nr:ABC transporter ATP-binding protein [Aeromicrobium sp. S22]MRK01042.1 ATP-binding cassette domain-containing protein [Aeromicrobium sp. S22]
MSTQAPTHDLLPVASARDTAVLAWRMVRGRAAGLALTITSFLVVGLAGIIPVLMIGRVVDAVRDGSDASVIHRAVAVMVVSGILGGVFATLSMAALAHTVAPALAQLREDVLDRALHLETARIEAAGIGDIVSRVGDDVRHLTRALDEAIPLLINSLAAVVFTAGGLFALDWRLGLAGLGAIPCYVFALRWYLPRSAPFYARQRTAEGERADALVTGVHGASTLRAFGREHDALERIDRRSQEAVDITVGVFRLYTRFGARMNSSEFVGLALVLSAGFLLVRDDAVTVGAATTAALFFHRLFNPIGALLFVFDSVQSSGAALARLAGVALIPRRPVSTQEPGPAPDLVLQGVHHAYEADREILSAIDLRIAPGEHVAVVGSTGAGKTTLGSIAAGTIEPTAGTVRLGQLDLVAADEATVRRHVALVSQEVHVFAGSLRDNLVLARADADDELLWQALRRTGSEPWARALPEQLDTQVGDLGAPLSPAQAQQLALARVLLLDPQVVVLDEATAEAGSSGARELEQAALAAIAGRSAIVVAHRLAQAQSADRIVVMDRGRIVEQGTHEELVSSGGRYADLWTAWAS